MGFEPMIFFNILIQQINALNHSANLPLKIFYPAAGSPTTTMLRLHPGHYPYIQLNNIYKLQKIFIEQCNKNLNFHKNIHF